jgi:hypothetical protein
MKPFTGKSCLDARKHTIYSMDWGQMDLSRHLVAASPFGGPIALILNEKKIVAYQGFTKNILHIYNNCGKLMNQIQWDKGTIVKMGWIEGERLACVMEQGIIYILDIEGNFTLITLGDDAEELGIFDAVICLNEIVVITNHYRFISVSSNTFRPKRMPDLGFMEPPNCWDVLPAKSSLSGHLEIFCAINGTLYVIDQIKAQNQV